MNDQMENLNLRQLRALLQARIDLQDASERMARDARKAVVQIALTLCPKVVNDMRVESPDGLDPLSIAELVDLVVNAVQPRLRRLEMLEASPAAAVTNEKVARLEAEIEQLRRQLRSHASASPTEPKLVPSVPAAPSNEPQPQSDMPGKPPWRLLRARPAPPRPAVPFDAWPGWAREWKENSPNFSRECDVVIVVGTGLALRKDVDEQLSEWWNVTPKSGSIRRAFARVEKAGLVEIIKPERTTRVWRPSYLVRLTQRGQDAYRLFRGESPGPSHTTVLLNRHKSAEHAALNIEAAGMLWQAGYEVTLFPDPVQVEGGEYCPDLVVTKEGETLYVECERATYKNHAERASKWSLYYTASAGQFYIFTPSEDASGTIQEEVLAWAGNRPLALWMADMNRSRESSGLLWQQRGPVP